MENFIKNFNIAVGHINSHEAELVGLEAKIDALMIAMYKVCKTIQRPDIFEDVDNSFFRRFERHYLEIPPEKRSDFLNDVYKSLCQID